VTAISIEFEMPTVDISRLITTSQVWRVAVSIAAGSFGSNGGA
jgi:hypothetical protein